MIFLLIRDLLVYLFMPVLIADEAYYMNWGKNLKLDYYDHPFITGLISSYSVKNNKYIKRFPFLILSLLTHFLTFKIYDIILINKDYKNMAFLWYSILNCTYPLVIVDTIFNFLWTSCIYSSLSIIKFNSNIISLFPITFLGLSTKYNFILIFFVWFFISLYDNKFLFNIDSYITIISCIIFYLPVFLNNKNSYEYQFNHFIYGNMKNKKTNINLKINNFLIWLIPYFIFKLFNLNLDHIKNDSKILVKSYLISIYLFFLILSPFVSYKFIWHYPLYNIFIFTFINFNLSPIFTILIPSAIIILLNLKNFIFWKRFCSNYDLKIILDLLHIKKNHSNCNILISDKYQLLALIDYHLPNVKIYQIGKQNSEFLKSKKNKDFFKNLDQKKLLYINEQIKINGYCIFNK